MDTTKGGRFWCAYRDLWNLIKQYPRIPDLYDSAAWAEIVDAAERYQEEYSDIELACEWCTAWAAEMDAQARRVV